MWTTRSIAVVSLIVAVGLGQGMTVFGQGMTPPGSMGGGGMMGVMGMIGGPFAPSARPLSMAQAEQILRQWPAAHHLDGLVLNEVEAYTQNYYGQFKERGTGRGGMIGGESAQGPNAAPAASHLSEAQARQRANRFLRGYLPGAVTGDADTFYGYYHFDVMRNGRQVGMLSVNDATGQVWYHTWHGEFLDKREVANP